MIEYAKVILKNVSPWETLFRKELVKCLQWAEPEEIDELHLWCFDNFYDKHPQIIADLCLQQKWSVNIQPDLDDFETEAHDSFVFEKLKTA